MYKRQGVNNSNRVLHGALLDSEILADVYLYMTGGQEALLLDSEKSADGGEQLAPLADLGLDLPVVRASADELAAHETNLEKIDKACDNQTVWRELLPN